MWRTWQTDTTLSVSAIEKRIPESYCVHFKSEDVELRKEKVRKFVAKDDFICNPKSASMNRQQEYSVLEPTIAARHALLFPTSTGGHILITPVTSSSTASPASLIKTHAFRTSPQIIE
jgi:hypothetical protein